MRNINIDRRVNFRPINFREIEFEETLFAWKKILEIAAYPSWATYLYLLYQ